MVQRVLFTALSWPRANWAGNHFISSSSLTVQAKTWNLNVIRTRHPQYVHVGTPQPAFLYLLDHTVTQTQTPPREKLYYAGSTVLSLQPASPCAGEGRGPHFLLHCPPPVSCGISSRSVTPGKAAPSSPRLTSPQSFISRQLTAGRMIHDTHTIDVFAHFCNTDVQLCRAQNFREKCGE